MTTPYLVHFGFSSAPFSKEIPDDKLWLPASKVSLIDEICEALKDRESVLLTGEPGVGKTCVLRAIRQRLPQAGFRLTYCHNATLGRRDFYRQLCFALGLSPSATAAAVFWGGQHPRRRARPRAVPSGLPARRGPPAAPGRARPSPHPAQLPVGLEGVALARPCRPARAAGPTRDAQAKKPRFTSRPLRRHRKAHA